jgi:hypothetical protein
MQSSGMLHRVALVRTDVSQERNVSIIRVTRIDELGTTLAVISHPGTQLVVPRSPILVPPKRRSLQEPHSFTYQKTAFFIVIAVKTSNLT